MRNDRLYEILIFNTEVCYILIISYKYVKLSKTHEKC